ncbi:hypothetical protein TIFTF001_036855 [Ficus carica]|uniref:Uncharacterized protein n=1 Tax=Ficus carica TaxID=3494 RepID=A0AA88JBR0_FICCA|nr:hypothetical protein TIFTF001_036855 [Ficus carica]
MKNFHIRTLPKQLTGFSSLGTGGRRSAGCVGGVGRVRAWAEGGRGDYVGAKWGRGGVGGVDGGGDEKEREKWRKGGVGMGGEREREKWRAWAWREEAEREKLGGRSFEGEIGRRKRGGSFCRF